ncbi:MAG: glycosyltransferase [Bacteroidota bacterium]
MLVWIITVGEPLPIDGKNSRLLRSGLLANSLVKKGHDIVFWTSTFNHTNKTHRDDADRLIKLDDKYQLYLIKGLGYKKNISVQRVKDHRYVAKRFAALALTMPRPDIIVCSLPIIELCDEATKLGKLWDVPVVLDARDMWPDIFVNVFPPIFRKIAKKTIFASIFSQTYRACQNASAIIGITPKFVEWALTYTNREIKTTDRDFPLGYSETNINESDLLAAHEFWKTLGVEKNDGSFNICLFAYIGRMIDMPTIISASKKLLKTGYPHRFIICGEGDMLKEYKYLAEDCPNLLFPGWIDGAKIKALMQLSHVGLLPYRNEPDFLMSIPNKPIEYMSGKLPILSSLGGTIGQLLEEEKCGMVYTEGDPNSLFEKAEYLFNNPGSLNSMSKKAYALYQQRFVADKVYSELVNYLEELTVIHKNNKI